jgi:hypothetical protein
MSKTLLIALFLLLSIGGCATGDVGYAWLGTKVNHDWGNGGVIWSHATDHSQYKVHAVATSYCAKRSQPEPTIKFKGKDGEFYIYEFSCNYTQPTRQAVPVAPTLTTPASKAETQLTMEEAKTKCAKDLGFKFGTEGFGKCVLQLSK